MFAQSITFSAHRRWWFLPFEDSAVDSTSGLSTDVGFTTRDLAENSGKTKPSDLLGPEGLKYALLVGEEGLEPSRLLVSGF